MHYCDLKTLIPYEGVAAFSANKDCRNASKSIIYQHFLNRYLLINHIQAIMNTYF